MAAAAATTAEIVSCCRVYSGLADGSYTFRVMAMASATDGGTPASYFFTVDTTPPVVSNFTYTIR